MVPWRYWRRLSGRWATVVPGILLAATASAQTPPPPAGFSLGLALGSGWFSNPEDVPKPRRGDVYLGTEVTGAYRLPLWRDAALTATIVTFSEFYARDSAGGVNRLSGALSLSQRWQGATITLGASTRTSMNQALTRHESASSEISLGFSRAITLARDLTLTPSAGASRRFYGDGTEDQLRARAGLSLAHKRGAFTWSLGGGFSWVLEDKTPIQPRINDRTISANAGLAYEWARDREVSGRVSLSRTYSSQASNRTKSLGFAPQVMATLRF